MKSKRIEGRDISDAQSHQPAILIAEDDEDTRSMMRRLLEIKDYRILEATDGQQVIDITLHERVGLILLDLQLPKLDGYETTKTLRRNKSTSEIPIIIISGWDQPVHEETARAAGCNEYLLKPINFDELDTLLDLYLPIAHAASPSTNRARAVKTSF